MSVLAAPAQAATYPPEFEAAQVGLTYAVYAPKNPQNLSLTKFELLQCGPVQFGWDEQIVATYGKPSGNHIQFFESHRPCSDGPWPVALVKKFTVDGATARMYAGCDTPASCEGVTTSDVKAQGGWVTVTLNGVPVSNDNAGLSSTYVDFYSSGISASKLTKFVKSMRIPS